MNFQHYTHLSETEYNTVYPEQNLNWMKPPSKPEFTGYIGSAEYDSKHLFKFPTRCGEKSLQEGPSASTMTEIKGFSWNPLHTGKTRSKADICGLNASTGGGSNSAQTVSYDSQGPRNLDQINRFSDSSLGQKLVAIASDPAMCSPQSWAYQTILEHQSSVLQATSEPELSFMKEQASTSTLPPTGAVTGQSSDTISHDSPPTTKSPNSAGFLATATPSFLREGVPSQKNSEEWQHTQKARNSRSKLFISKHMQAEVERNQFFANIRFNLPTCTAPTDVRISSFQKPVSLSLVERLTQMCREGLCGAEFARNVCQKIVLAQVLVIKGIQSEAFNLKEVTSLFSNYGNILFGACFPMLGCACIMYSTESGAELGFQHLKSLNIRGFKVQVQRLQHFEGLDPCYLVDHSEVYVPPTAHRRFKQEIPRQANGVSSTLHVCVFYPGKRRVVTNTEIAEHFSYFGIVPQQLRRDPNPEHFNMWFADFRNASEAVVCLMRAHDSPFEEGNVRISFTKSKRSSEYKNRGD